MKLFIIKIIFFGYRLALEESVKIKGILKKILKFIFSKSSFSRKNSNKSEIANMNTSSLRL